MSKGMKNTMIVLVIVLIVFCILCVVYGKFQTEPMNANTQGEKNIIKNANNGLDNMINEILNEEENNQEQGTSNNAIEQNQEKNNTSSSNKETAGSTNKNDSSKDETEADNTITPREKKAIELVKEEWKKEWGNDSDVSFNNVGIQSDGKYRVSVNDSSTTQVLQFYIVDVDTGIVKEK